MSSFKRRLMMAQQVGNVDYSLDGQYQTTSTLYGGYLYTSSDYGQTWEKHSLSSTVQSISISATGQYQTAVGSPNSSGYIYIFHQTMEKLGRKRNLQEDGVQSLYQLLGSIKQQRKHLVVISIPHQITVKHGSERDLH